MKGDTKGEDEHESTEPSIAGKDFTAVGNADDVEKSLAEQGDEGKVEKRLADTQIREQNDAPVVSEDQPSFEKKRTHEETEHESLREPVSPEIAKRVEERPKSPLKSNVSTLKATFGTMGSSAASPFASLASSSSPFASVQPSTEEVKHAALKSTFGAGFSGSSFGSLASPAKKPRTQGHEGEEGQDVDDGEAEEARNDASKQKAFGNMLEKEDEGTSSEQQYVQVSQPLVEQDHVTGEETEATVHSIRAKLFVARKEGWKERGVGQVRINIAKEEKMLAPRLVMRADAVFKLLLNAPLFPGMEVQGSGDNSDEGLSSDRFVRMVVFEESKPVTIAFKFSTSNHARDFREKVVSLVPKEPRASSSPAKQGPPSPTTNPTTTAQEDASSKD